MKEFRTIIDTSPNKSSPSKFASNKVELSLAQKFCFNISLDTQGYGTKPDNNEAGKISIRVGKSPQAVDNNNIIKVIEAIAAKGHTFSPVTFKGGIRKTAYFEQMQLFVLDFDGTISLQEAYARARQYELPILFAYETFSSVN